MAPNHLPERAQPPARPGEVGQTDITYVATKEGWLYLAGVLDACSHRIVGGSAEDLAPYQQLDPAADAIRQRFLGPLILAVGRLVYYKGFEVLLQAMRQVAAAATLLIVGEGPLRSALEAKIVAWGLAGRVHLLGNVPKTIQYYQACDLFVLPSVARSEAFGIVQLEAMACGKSVVNTRLEASGVPFVSRHGESGLTVAPGNSAELASALNRLLHDAALRSRFGQAGKNRVKEEFTAQMMVDRTLAVYRRLVGAIE